MYNQYMHSMQRIWIDIMGGIDRLHGSEMNEEGLNEERYKLLELQSVIVFLHELFLNTNPKDQFSPSALFPIVDKLSRIDLNERHLKSILSNRDYFKERIHYLKRSFDKELSEYSKLKETFDDVTRKAMDKSLKYRFMYIPIICNMSYLISTCLENITPDVTSLRLGREGARMVTSQVDNEIFRVGITGTEQDVLFQGNNIEVWPRSKPAPKHISKAGSHESPSPRCLSVRPVSSSHFHVYNSMIFFTYKHYAMIGCGTEMWAVGCLRLDSPLQGYADKVDATRDKIRDDIVKNNPGIGEEELTQELDSTLSSSLLMLNYYYTSDSIINIFMDSKNIDTIYNYCMGPDNATMATVDYYLNYLTITNINDRIHSHLHPPSQSKKPYRLDRDGHLYREGISVFTRGLYGREGMEGHIDGRIVYDGNTGDRENSRLGLYAIVFADTDRLLVSRISQYIHEWKQVYFEIMIEKEKDKVNAEIGRDMIVDLGKIPDTESISTVFIGGTSRILCLTITSDGRMGVVEYTRKDGWRYTGGLRQYPPLASGNSGGVGTIVLRSHLVHNGTAEGVIGHGQELRYFKLSLK